MKTGSVRAFTDEGSFVRLAAPGFDEDMTRGGHKYTVLPQFCGSFSLKLDQYIQDTS